MQQPIILPGNQKANHCPDTNFVMCSCFNCMKLTNAVGNYGKRKKLYGNQ